jgi:hypothetical protein
MKLLIFDEQMTKEVYSGRKTMARVYMERQPSMPSHVVFAEVEDAMLKDARGSVHLFPFKRTFPLREWWRRAGHGFEYKTDGIDPDGKWTNPTNLPIKAARMWLEITEVYCERFSEISGTEFDAEGIKPAKEIGLPSYWDYTRKMYSAKTKQNSIESYYMSKIPNLRRDEWGWVIHFQSMTAL